MKKRFRRYAMKGKAEFSCGLCSAAWQRGGQTNCWRSGPEDGPKRPAYCPANGHGDILRETVELYEGDGEDARMARVAGKVEGLCYTPVAGSGAVNARWTRVEDTIAFAKLMGFTRIGIATCIGLLEETNRLASVLRAQGLDPLSVCCRTGSLDKLAIGLEEKDKVRPSTFEPACNPVAQARLLNRAGTDMNVIVGLCVGHDMIFAKHSDAPVTTLVVKDRVTGHNPVSVLYGQNFYYRRLGSQKLDLER
jgi:uncharacterized metal-binding protein